MKEILSRLQKLEFSIVRFRLEFLDPLHLSPLILLRLRKDLRRAARQVMESGSEMDPYFFEALFDPPVPTDPLAVRRHQRPGPLFTILPQSQSIFCQAGDTAELTVVFWGRGIACLADFAQALQCLGDSGLYQGNGRFELAGVYGEDPSGTPHRLAGRSFRQGGIAPVINNGGWWIESRPMRMDKVLFRFQTPARLISAGKPLFRPTIHRLFPFILRRVTGLAQSSCGLDLLEDPSVPLSLIQEVQEMDNRLRWQDWRTLSGDTGDQEIGGVMGSVLLAGEGLREILWILQLGSLMNLGKGAAFAAGHYQLDAAPVQ